MTEVAAPVTTSTEGLPADAANTAAETTQGQPADLASETHQEPEEAKKPHWAKKRIDELTAEKYELRRERDRLLEVALRNQQAAPVQTVQQAPVVPPTPPTLEQFNFDANAYAAAQAAYIRDMVRAETEASIRQQQEIAQQRAQAQTEYEIAQSFAKRATEAAQKYPDFAYVTQNPALTINEPMAHAIKRMENGPEVAYHLGKNPEEAARIARLDQYSAAAEIGRLSARLSTVPVRTTNAPPPPPTIGGGQSLARDIGQMTMAEFIAHRNAQLNPPRK